MGVDIYGISPKLTSSEPEMPKDYDEFTSEQQSAYWSMRQEWEQSNPGFYFRNNWWHWRPLQMLVSVFNKAYELNIPEETLTELGSNGGGGIKDKGICEQLAKCFKEFAEQMKNDNQSVVYLNTGWWHFKDKDLNSSKSITDETLIEQLNTKFPGIFFEAPTLDGVDYEVSHATNLDNIEEFALFLENCNGFEVY